MEGNCIAMDNPIERPSDFSSVESEGPGMEWVEIQCCCPVERS